MANSGYANAGNLNDAKELQKMFKGQGSSNITAKPRGKSKSKGGNSLPMKRRETFPHPHRGPPPTSTNVPPPSARYYTATLLSDPLKRVPGAILGTATLAFLSRQDSAPQTPTIPAQTAKPLIAENQAPIKAPATVSAGEIKSANKEEQSKGVAAKPPVMGNQAPATVFSGERKQVTTAVSAGENLQVPAIVSTGEGKQIPTIVSTGETKVANKEGESKKSLASMFFSLMSGDSDEDSDEESPAVKVNAEAVSKSATTGVIKYSSDELLELKGKLPLEPAKIVLQQKHRGKTELSPEAMANTSLRPEAPGFIPSVAAKMAAHLANEPNKPVKDRKPTKGLGSSMWAK